MRKSRKVFKLVLSIIFCLGIYGSGFLLNYGRYSDKEEIKYQALIYENNYLKNELGSIKGYKEYSSIGKVIFRDFSDFYGEIVVYGKDIEVGSAVLSSEGLVGIVKNVDKGLGYVSLLNDISLSVKIGDDYGTLKGNKIEFISKYAKIKEGDLVYTSGLGYLPSKLYVGRVSKVSYDSDGLGIVAKVLLCETDNLNYVYFVRGEGV